LNVHRAIAPIALTVVAAACAKADGAATTSSEGTRTHSADVRVGPRVACGPRGLPPDRHFAAEGLCARVVALGGVDVPVRTMTFAPDGDLFTVSAAGTLVRHRDVDSDGLYSPAPPETTRWASASTRTCRFYADDLYCTTATGVVRWHWSHERDEGGAAEEVVTGMPDAEAHDVRPLGLWDGYLYVATAASSDGSPPASAEYDASRGVVKRFPATRFGSSKSAAWKDGELVVRGVRSLAGLTRDLGGRIVALDEAPAERGGPSASALVVVAPGKRYGAPFCAYDASATPRAMDGQTARNAARTKATRDDAWCRAHADAPLDVLPGDAGARAAIAGEGSANAPRALPERWRNGALVALHGGPRRGSSSGHKVAWLPLERRDAASAIETVFGGGKYRAPRDGEWSWRLGDAGEDPVAPAALAVSPVDGALYVASDGDVTSGAGKGAIYRIALLGR